MTPIAPARDASVETLAAEAALPPAAVPAAGCEWVVDAHGCDAQALRRLESLEAFFAKVIEALDLHPVGGAVWHQFPGSGGITGFQMLAESHLACHTFPEHGSLCLNLFCCRPRPEWDFGGAVRLAFGARAVDVRRIERTYAAPAAEGSCRP
jgi:S-adenosylmethionine decarboxylase